MAAIRESAASQPAPRILSAASRVEWKTFDLDAEPAASGGGGDTEIAPLPQKGLVRISGISEAH